MGHIFNSIMNIFVCLQKSQLTKHRQCHENTIFNCPFCPNKTVKTKSTMVKHLRNMHEDRVDIWKEAGYINALASERFVSSAASSLSPPPSSLSSTIKTSLMKPAKYQKKIKISNENGEQLQQMMSGGGGGNGSSVMMDNNNLVTKVQRTGHKYIKKCDRDTESSSSSSAGTADSNNNNNHIHFIGGGGGGGTDLRFYEDSRKRSKSHHNGMLLHHHHQAANSPLLPQMMYPSDQRHYYPTTGTSVSSAVNQAAGGSINDVPYFYNIHQMGVAPMAQTTTAAAAASYQNNSEMSSAAVAAAANSATLMTKFQQTLEGLETSSEIMPPTPPPSHMQSSGPASMAGCWERNSSVDDDNSFENFYDDYMVL